MKRKFVTAAGAALVAVLALSACSGGQTGSSSADGGPVTLSLSGWSLSNPNSEFTLLADQFMAKNPDITIQLKEYDPANYNTLLTADLAAGTGPDIITQKEIKFVPTLEQGGQLADVSDVALPDGIGGADAYKIDGKQYAVPYRQDSWVLFYNKALFDAAGVAYPDGSWTWDDYAKAESELSTKLASQSVYGGYQHSWQSTVQGFASAQTPDADITSGNYDYLKPYYERALKMQDTGGQIDFNTRNANQLTYASQFGKQKAAMMLMGSWYVASLKADVASGNADTFDWGIAPVPQYDTSTTGTTNTPVTFGDPTGFGINAADSGAKLDAAKKFLSFAMSEDAAKTLAAVGITPALFDPAVVDTYFSVSGVPTDDLSKFAISTHETKPENPTSANTAAIQGILGDLHTAVMSESTPLDDAIKTAEDRAKNEVGIG